MRYVYLVSIMKYLLNFVTSHLPFHFACLQGAAAAPKRTVKESDPTNSSSGGGLDSLPREDISGKITPTLLKGLESTDWKV